MAFSDQQLEDLRERSDIVAIIGRRVQLKKTGKDHQGLCPFHGDRTPSFNVVPSKHFWHCFGCGESGDVFKFFMKLDGLPFMDAVRQVATESGVILTEERADPEEAKRRARLDELASLLDRAVRFYEQKLWHESGRAAQEHLKKRGISDEFARKFHLGFGGVAMDDLSRALEKAGVPGELAVEAGLCIASKRGGRGFDRFHGRLIVPIRVPRPPDGRTVALGGRFLEGITDAAGSTPDRKHAKYINSPETPLYQKGHILFGLDQARDSIRKEEKAVIVEGYFDVIGCHQAGLPLAVATCGTSLTANHLDLLMRTAAREIIFLFDGDDAGTRAAVRAAEMCAKAQVPARVATLPTGLDPDEFARQRGIEALRALLDRARPAVEMLIDHSLDGLGPSATVEDRVRAVQAVRGVVMASPEGLSRDLYIGQIATKLGVSDAVVKSALTEQPRPVRPRPGAATRLPVERGPHTPVGPRRTATERSDGSPAVDDGAAPPLDAGDTLPPRKGAPPAAPKPDSLARHTFPSEEGIAIATLKYPALADTVAQEGVLVDFGQPELRTLVESVIAARQENREVQPLALLAAIQEPALRARIQRDFAQSDGSIEEMANHLIRVLDKLRVLIARNRTRAAAVASRGETAAPDEAAVKAQLERIKADVDRRKVLRLRERERDRRT